MPRLRRRGERASPLRPSSPGRRSATRRPCLPEHGTGLRLPGATDELKRLSSAGSLGPLASGRRCGLCDHGRASTESFRRASSRA